jgi:hypothetical protein
MCGSPAPTSNPSPSRQQEGPAAQEDDQRDRQRQPERCVKVLLHRPALAGPMQAQRQRLDPAVRAGDLVQLGFARGHRLAVLRLDLDVRALRMAEPHGLEPALAFLRRRGTGEREIAEHQHGHQTAGQYDRLQQAHAASRPSSVPCVGAWAPRVPSPESAGPSPLYAITSSSSAAAST